MFQLFFTHHARGDDIIPVNGQLPYYVEFRDDGSLFHNYFHGTEGFTQSQTYSFCDGAVFDRKYEPTRWRHENDHRSIMVDLTDLIVYVTCDGSSNRVSIPTNLQQAVRDWLSTHAVKE